MRTPTIPFPLIIDELQTGDLFFCRGLLWSSRWIEFITGSKWSHVAVVVRPRDIGLEGVPDEPYLWEATSIEGSDILTGRRKTGPMLVRMWLRLQEYLDSGNYRLFGVRYLQTPRTQDLFAGLASIIKDNAVQDSRYPEELQMMKDYLKQRYFTSRQQRTFFCSELVAETYTSMQLMPQQPAAPSYGPRDFSQRGYLPLLKRAALSPEVYLGAHTREELQRQLSSVRERFAPQWQAVLAPRQCADSQADR